MGNRPEKIAFFDFCETLVNFQTGDAFVDYIRSRRKTFFMNVLDIMYRISGKVKLLAFCNKLFPGASAGKRFKLLQLKSIRKEDIELYARDYYEEAIKPNLIEPVIKILQDCKNEGYTTCIVSAGYTDYINHFKDAFKIDYIIATDIAYSRNNYRCKGRFDGRDCIGEEKIRRINILFSDRNIDYESSLAYSDSLSDLPLLQLTGNAFVISRAKTQKWSEIYNFKEIIWE